MENAQDYPPEPFSIYFLTRVKGGYEVVVRGIYEGLVHLGWKLAELDLYKGNNEVDTSDMLPVEVLRVPLVKLRHTASAKFLKDDRHVFVWIAYDAVFDDGAPPHGIEIMSHNTFFDSPEAFNELKTLFSHLHLPEKTVVTGDTFFTFMDEGKTWLFMWNDQASGFNWIDTMKCSMWENLMNSFPAMEENLLAKVDEYCIVAMGESPFAEKDEKVKVSPTARKRKPKSYIPKWFRGQRSP